MAGRFSVEGVFRAVDRFTGPVRRMQSRMRGFTRSTEQGLRALDRQASGVLRGFGRIGAAAAAAGVAVGAVGANVVRTGAEFEQSLTSAAARMGGGVTRGTEAFAAMEEAARRVGAETEHTASSAAEGLGFLAMAGFSAERAIAALPGVVDLATASGLELGRATDIITDSMGPLGLATDDAAQAQINLARVSDVLAATATSTNTNVEQMFEAIVAGGNMATAAGQSVEGFAALVGSMANDGIKGEQAGTALRNMFMRLQAPTGTAAGLLEQFGVQVADGEGNMRDMTAIIADLSDGMQGMGNVARNAALTEIFGARAVGPALSLINQGSESLRGLRTQLENAGGATQRMAGQMRDTTSGDMASFVSMVESIKLAIFDVVRGPLREVISSIIEWGRANREVISSGIQDFVTWFSTNLDTIIQRAEGIAFVAAGFLAIATAIKAASAAQALFNLIAMANPYVLVIMAIVAAIGVLIAYWPEISAFFSDMWDKAKEIGGKVADWFSETWGSIVDGLTAAWDWVKSIFGEWVDFIVGIHTAIAEVFVGIAAVILEPFMPGLRMLADVFMAVVDFLGAMFAAMWQDIKSRATAVAEWVVAVWNRIAAFVQPMVDMVKMFFAAMWDDITSRAQSVYDTFVSIWGGLRSFFSGLWEGVVAGFNEYIMPLIEAVAGFISNLRGIGQGVLGTGGESSEGSSSSEPQVVTPQERVSRSISESSTTSSSTVEIRDRTGRARMTGGGPGITFVPSGAPA